MAHKRWLVIGFVYGVLLEVWSFSALGIGHGTALPLFISFAPVSLIGFAGNIESFDSAPPVWLTPILLLAPALMWAFAAFVLVRATPSSCSRRMFLWFIGAHYIGVTFVLFQFREGLGGTTEPIWMMAWLLTYLFGQVAIWGVFMHIHVWSRQ